MIPGLCSTGSQPVAGKAEDAIGTGSFLQSNLCWNYDKSLINDTLMSVIPGCLGSKEDGTGGYGCVCCKCHIYPGILHTSRHDSLKDLNVAQYTPQRVGHKHARLTETYRSRSMPGTKNLHKCPSPSNSLLH
jgi:hypothetical protein